MFLAHDNTTRNKCVFHILKGYFIQFVEIYSRNYHFTQFGGAGFSEKEKHECLLSSLPDMLSCLTSRLQFCLLSDTNTPLLIQNLAVLNETIELTCGILFVGLSKNFHDSSQTQMLQCIQ